MEYQYLLTEEKDGIFHIQLHRPQALNALCPQLNRELESALAQCQSRQEIRVVILSGGEKAFAAGADIGAMAQASPAQASRLSEQGRRINELLEAMDIPVIAAVRGLALGGGCELALACDFRVCGESAVFAFPEVGLGILPGAGGTQRLVDAIGSTRAREMILLGRRVSGVQALEIGLSTVTVADDEVMGEAEKLAHQLKKFPAYSIGAAKRALVFGQAYGTAAGKEMERAMFSLAFSMPDQREGMAAFLEKRKPVFTHER